VNEDFYSSVLIALVVVIIALLLAGCAGAPVCTWHPVDKKELADRCNDWSPNLRGCQTGADRCDLWVLR
jgi:hypothetical protein